jgi:hypothetical protein
MTVIDRKSWSRNLLLHFWIEECLHLANAPSDQQQSVDFVRLFPSNFVKWEKSQAKNKLFPMAEGGKFIHSYENMFSVNLESFNGSFHSYINWCNLFTIEQLGAWENRKSSYSLLGKQIMIF